MLSYNRIAFDSSSSIMQTCSLLIMLQYHFWRGLIEVAEAEIEHLIIMQPDKNYNWLCF